MTTRRDLFRTAALAGSAALSGSLRAQAPAKGPFTLPPLPYPADALEPHIDAKTMEIHHGRHHAAYVNNLNGAAATHPPLAKMTLEDMMRGLDKLPESVRTIVRNNGGGHANHALFWQLMSKSGGGVPKGELVKAIEKQFKSFDNFKDQFTRAALGVFGSGWAWLGFDGKGQLHIHTTPNQDNPWMEGHHPILALDVWEHAYYLKYQNRRADYVNAWWNVVNWDFVHERFRKR